MTQYDEFILEVRHDNEVLATYRRQRDRTWEETAKKSSVSADPQVRKYLDYFVELLNRGDLDEKGIKMLGEGLYDALFSGQIGALFDEAMESVRSTKRKLRVWISVDQMSQIVRWPLEFLRSSSGKFWLATENQYITLSRNISFQNTSCRPKRHGPPLKILIVVSKPNDLGGLMTRAIEDISKWAAGVEGESSIQIKLLGTVEKFELAPNVQYLEKSATLANIKAVNASFAPDILHFIGHGRVKGDESALALVDDYESGEWCTAGEFQEIIQGCTPSLIVLQACESAQPTTGSGFMSLAAHLVQTNIPAVVAMQFEFRNDCATEFATAFYQAIANGLEVDAAVQNGRSTISLSSSLKVRWRERHFGTPVLFMLSPEGIILPVSASATPGAPERQLETSLDVPATAKSTSKRQDLIKELIQDAVSKDRLDLAQKLIKNFSELEGIESPKRPGVELERAQPSTTAGIIEAESAFSEASNAN